MCQKSKNMWPRGDLNAQPSGHSITGIWRATVAPLGHNVDWLLIIGSKIRYWALLIRRAGSSGTHSNRIRSCPTLPQNRVGTAHQGTYGLDERKERCRQCFRGINWGEDKFFGSVPIANSNMGHRNVSIETLFGYTHHDQWWRDSRNKLPATPEHQVSFID